MDFVIIILNANSKMFIIYAYLRIKKFIYIF